MIWLIAGAVFVIAWLVWAYRLDHRGSPHRFGPYGPDEVRTRIEGNAVLGRDWRSSRRRP